MIATARTIKIRIKLLAIPAPKTPNPLTGPIPKISGQEIRKFIGIAASITKVKGFG